MSVQNNNWWYAVQAYGGNEEDAREKLKKEFPEIKTFIPKRELEIRKGGKIKKEKKPLFPGYIFISFEEKIDYEKALEVLRRCRTTGLKTSITKFLGIADTKISEKKEVLPVKTEEIAYIFELTQESETINFSKFVKSGTKIKILEGPLKGKEAVIKKVNARKKRITVEIYLMGKTHEIDLGGSLAKDFDLEIT
ncbi:MAG: antiterminator LoaP [Spirochaetia bacterium]|nr:antiterminator LoaP [Spirochaetia bacterium]